MSKNDVTATQSPSTVTGWEKSGAAQRRAIVSCRMASILYEVDIETQVKVKWFRTLSRYSSHAGSPPPVVPRLDGGLTGNPRAPQLSRFFRVQNNRSRPESDQTNR